MSEKSNKKFNIIDVIIIAVIVVALAAVVVIKGKRPAAEETFSDKKIVTLEILEKRVGFSENVTIGDKVTEKVEKKQIGKVIGVSARPSEKNSFDRKSGEATVAKIPEREDVYVTMELDASAEVAVGKQLSIVTKNFSGHGYVTEITEGGQQ